DCGYIRVPAQKPSVDDTEIPDNTDKPDTSDKPDNTDKPDTSDKPDSDDEPDNSDKPDINDTDNGFVIDKATDGLILEGLANEYTLSKQTPSFDFTAVELEVYLSSDGEKGKSVPRNNYSLTVTYGGKQPVNLEKLTADGTYTVTVALKDFGYSRTVTEDGVYSQTDFDVVNPVSAIRLISGNTTQYESKTDKISENWIFGGIRANGDKFDIPKSEVKISALTTDVAGTHTVVAEYRGVTAQIEYTVVAHPQVIDSVEVIYDSSEKFVDEGEAFSLGVNDFTVLVTADNSYKYESSTVLSCGETECENLDLSARDEPYSVKLRTTFTYTVEDETVTVIFEHEFSIKVTARVVEPQSPNLTVDGEVISALGGTVNCSAVLAESEKGDIKITPSDNVTVSAGGCKEIEIGGKTFNSVLTVAGSNDSFQTCKDIKFSLKESAVITVYFSTDEFVMMNIEGADGNVYYSDDYYSGSGKAALNFHLGQGEYALALLGNVNIYCIEAVFV
ncbi:MAG: hypothetical protein K2N50_03085, partial [Clostridia bacterium]|nr:hypothetical protein [Clostridia bacterium]